MNETSLILAILHHASAYLHITLSCISSAPHHAHAALPHALIAAPQALPVEVKILNLQKQISPVSFGQMQSQSE